MRKSVLISLLCGALTCSIWAQTRATKGAASTATDVKIITAGDLAAIVAKQPGDKNAVQPFIQLPPYSVNMEHRIMGQGAAVHEKDAELFYVIDGSGTLVTG